MSIIRKALFLCFLKIDILMCMMTIPDDSLKTSNNSVRVWVLNVGQGNCIAIRKGDRSVLIDAGNSSEARISKSMSQEQANKIRSIAKKNQELEYKNITKLTEEIFYGSKIYAIVVTHAHYDHYSFLLNNSETWRSLFDSPVLILGGDRDAYMKPCKEEGIVVCIADKIKNNILANEIIYTENDGSMVNPQILREKLNGALGMNINSEDEGFFPILPLNPLPREQGGENDHSLVLSLSSRYIDGTESKLNTLLFTGDATNKTFGEIKKQKTNLDQIKKTNVAVVPHHGSIDALDWYLFLYRECNELLGCMVSVDIEASEYQHPRSIINGESIVKQYGGIEFLFEGRRFMFNRGANNRLYEVELNSKQILSRVDVSFSNSENVGDFTKALLSGIQNMNKIGKGKLPKEVLKCEIRKANLPSGEVSIIVPQFSKLSGEMASIPHMQSYFLDENGDNANPSATRMLTMFPVYSTGDTSLGYYELILNRCGLYLLLNPGMADENGDSVISVSETQDVLSYPVVNNLRIPDCCFLVDGGVMGVITEGLYANQEGWPSVKFSLHNKLKQCEFGSAISESAIAEMKSYKDFLEEGK